MQISELKPRLGNVEVTGEITSKSEPRTFQKMGEPGKVCNAKLKDPSGEVTLTLWNEQVDEVKVGDMVKITNGYVSEWQGEMQLSTGKFGKLEVVEKQGSLSADQPAEPEPEQKPAQPEEEKVPEQPQEDISVEEEDF